MSAGNCYDSLRDCAFCEGKATAHIAGYGICPAHQVVIAQIARDSGKPATFDVVQRRTRATPSRLPVKPCKPMRRHGNRTGQRVAQVCKSCDTEFEYTYLTGKKRVNCYRCNPRAKAVA